MNKHDAYLAFKKANGIHEPTFKDESHYAPPQGRHIKAEARSKYMFRPAVQEGEFAHLTNQQARDAARRGWAGLSKEQLAERKRMNRAAANTKKSHGPSHH